MRMIHIVLMLGRPGGTSAFPDKEDWYGHNCGAGKDPLEENIPVSSRALGIAGEIISHGGEKTEAVKLKLLEAQQKRLADTVGHLASRLNVMFWAAVAVLVVAFGALAAALLE